MEATVLQTYCRRRYKVLTSDCLRFLQVTYQRVFEQEEFSFSDGKDVDVLIIGTGPVGATFARKTLDSSDLNVLMVDIGALLSRIPGANLKNAAYYQKDINPFTDVVKGHLHKLSVPVDDSVLSTIDPFSYEPPVGNRASYELANQNPKQVPLYNLSGAEATYAVGGMGTHWTCSIPRTHPILERSGLIPNEEWDVLYTEAEGYLMRTQDAFNDSIRNTVVRESLLETFTEIDDTPYPPQNLALSVKRRDDNKTFWQWGSSGVVFGDWAQKCEVDDAENPEELPMGGRRFVIKEQHICRRLVFDGDDPETLKYAVVENLLHGRVSHIYAKKFIVCGGTVLGAQLLWASNIRPPALGHYLTEQPLAFCQILLSKDIIDKIQIDPRFEDKRREHHLRHPNDPVPIPLDDPDPQCWIPLSEGREWHCQIHRDAFAFGSLPSTVDKRLVVDFRWFGLSKQRKENKVTFSNENKDIFGMPQPTFYFVERYHDSKRNHEMMYDMIRATREMGGFLPGSNPQFMEPGASLHLHGHTRIGNDPAKSVADPTSKVWNTKNLWIGGCGTIDTAIACNPTLTACAIAIKAVKESVLLH